MVSVNHALTMSISTVRNAMIDLSANSAKKATLASTDSVYLALIDSEGSVSNARREVAQFAQRASL